MSIDQLMDAAIAEVAATAHKFPGVTIIHNFKNGKVMWMSQNGLAHLNTTNEILSSLEPELYYGKYFNPEDAKDYVPKILALVDKKHPTGYCVYFQQVRSNEHAPWAWHMSSTKVLLFDHEGEALLTITTSFPMDSMHHMTLKAERLLEENNFLRAQQHNFAKLTKREREVLKYMSLGKTAAETANELFISFLTVETHRKNIRKKLNTNSFYDLSQYARSFDLI